MAICNLRKIVTVPFTLDAKFEPEDGSVQYKADPMIVADPVVLQFMSLEEFEKNFCNKCKSPNCEVRLLGATLAELDDVE